MKKFAVMMFVSMMLTVACGRPIGTDQEDPDNRQYLTRGQLVRDLLVEIAMVHEANEDRACTSFNDDVDPNTTLCRSVMFLDHVGINFYYPDGLFHPEEVVSRAEMWKVVAEIMGFSRYVVNGLAPDIDSTYWYAWYAGSLHLRGLLMLDEDGTARPGEAVTREEWDAQMALLISWRNKGATKLDMAEKLVTLILREEYYPLDSCVSEYSDIAPDSLVCYLTETLLDEGILDPGIHTFRPESPITWDEALKGMFEASGEAEPDCTDGRCCDVSAETWSCAYFEGLCVRGLLDGYIVQGQTPIRGELLRTILHFKAMLDSPY